MRVHGQACPQARGQGLLEGHGGEMASVRGDFFKSQLVGAQEHAPKATHTDRSNLGSGDIPPRGLPEFAPPKKEPRTIPSSEALTVRTWRLRCCRSPSS